MTAIAGITKVHARLRTYERDTDALFVRLLRSRPDVVAQFASKACERGIPGTCEIKSQVRHVAGTGSIDITISFRGGPILLVENKIDAAYSITREGHGQPERYQRSVAAHWTSGREAYSVLLAPAKYLASSRFGLMFDVQIAYEDFLDLVSGDDRALLESAIRQAQAPYEAIVNAGATDFFAGIRQLISTRYSDLAMKHDPNAGGVRPDASRTIYFDVPRTLAQHADVDRPRMSLQCWDSTASSASVKIMLADRAAMANSLPAPQSLVDIGGYLRRAGRSLGIVIDTPRLETQRPFAEQADDILEALDAALRLQGWWNQSGEILRRW